MSRRHRRLMAVALAAVLTSACQPAAVMPLGVPTRPGDQGIADRATVTVAVQEAARFHVNGAPPTPLTTHHFQFTLKDAGTNTTVATATTGAGVLTATFPNLAAGTYYAVVDALDAANVSLLQGGAQTSSNQVTVAGNVATYTSGLALAVAVQYRDGTGGTVPVAISNPYAGGYGELLDPVSGALLSHYDSPTKAFHLLQVADGTYGFWGFGVSGGVIATPPRQAANVTVAGQGGSVSGSWNLTIPSVITTAIGGGPAGSYGLGNPEDVALDTVGNVYIADSSARVVRFMPATAGTYFGRAMRPWTTYTIAGTGANSDSGDGGPATAATFRSPTGIAVDSQGNVFVVDSSASRIRVIPAVGGAMFGLPSVTPGNIYTVAGNGLTGAPTDNVAGTASRLRNPRYLALDPAGNVVFGDTANHRVRVVHRNAGTYYGTAAAAGIIRTIVGTGATAFNGDGLPATGTGAVQIQSPTGVAVDANFNVYFNDQGHRRVRVRAGAAVPLVNVGLATVDTVYTVGGNGVSGYNGDGISATTAQFDTLQDLQLTPAGDLLVADSGQARLRLIPTSGGLRYAQSLTAGDAYTVVGDGSIGQEAMNVLATTSPATTPSGLGLDAAGNVLLADPGSGTVQRIALGNGTVAGLTALQAGFIHCLAGNGSGDDFGQGNLPTAVDLGGPMYVKQNAAGDLLWSENTTNRLWYQPAANGTYLGQPMQAGHSYLVAGNGRTTGPADGWPALFASIATRDVCFGPGGSIFVSDGVARKVWQIDSAGIVSTFAGNGAAGLGGNGGPATAASFQGPWGLCYQGGALYVTDFNGRNVRVVSGGIIQPFAGSPAGTLGNSGDGGPPAASLLTNPTAITFDPRGNCYIADQGTTSIRMIPASSGTYYQVPMTAGTINTAVTGVSPYNLSVDAVGHLVFADVLLPRLVSLAGDVYRLVGGVSAYAGDGSTADTASVYFPLSAIFLNNGDIMIADWANRRLRTIH